MESRRTIVTLNGSIALMMFGVGLITPLLPGKVLALSQSTVQVGILASAFALSYVLIQLPMGILADRLGHKLFIVTGYILCGVAGTLYLLSHSSSAILAGRVIQGLGEAPLWALGPAVLSLVNEQRKGRYIGLYNASIHLALTGGSLTGFLALGFFSEALIFQVYVVLCAMSALWALVGLQPPEHAVPPLGKRWQNEGLLKRPDVVAVLLGISLYGVGYGVFLTIVPTFMGALASGHDLSGLTFIACYVGISLAQFIGGPLVDRRGRVAPMLAGLSLYSICMLLFFRLNSLSALLLLLTAGFGLGIFLVSSLAYLNDQADQSSKGFVSGLFYFFWGGGFFFGPIALGYASAYHFSTLGFMAIGGAGLAATLFIGFTCRRLRLARSAHD